MGAREAVGEVHVVGALGLQQRLVHEGVEDELALEAEQVERLRAVLLEERAGRRPVLAQQDLRGVVRAVRRVGVLRAERGDQPLVLARRERGDEAARQPGAHGGLGALAEHLRGLHHVGVGVVHAAVRVGHQGATTSMRSASVSVTTTVSPTFTRSSTDGSRTFTKWLSLRRVAQRAAARRLVDRVDRVERLLLAHEEAGRLLAGLARSR